MTRATANAVAAIYDHTYAAAYPRLYFDAWQNKHLLNERNLKRIFDRMSTRVPRWLDLACGQAWHFSRFEGSATRVGVDLSEAQLECARANVEAAEFICADMTALHFPEASFDLVTSFWAAYCYLDDDTRIRRLMSQAVHWTAPGGALYFELLLPEDLGTFNRSVFAKHTGFRVEPRAAGYRKWRYFDIGGCHNMTSPPLDAFLGLVAHRFDAVEAKHDGAFMVHLLCQGRRA